MLVLSEENNKLTLYFDGTRDRCTLDKYDEQYLRDLYDLYKEKLHHLINSPFSSYIGYLGDINERDHILIEMDTINDFNLLKEFIDKINNIEIIIKGSDNEKIFHFVSLLNEDEVNNVFINYHFNSDNASIKDYKNMRFKINSLVHTIKSFNLSELETVMVVYDIVKANEYKKIPDALPFVTRAVHSVLAGDGCVCAGFSNYFNYLLNELGIKSYPIILDYSDDHSMHQRSAMYINDKKYEVEGIYMFDPTYDCKKDDKYIGNYDYFLQSVPFFKKYFEGEHIDSRISGNLDFYGFLNICEYALDDMNLLEIGKINRIISFLDKMCGKNNNNFLLLDSEGKVKFIKKYKKFLYKEVDYKRFIKLLYTVRQVEEEIGIVDEYSASEVVNTVHKRYKNTYVKLKNIRKLLIFELQFGSDNFLFDEKINKKIKEIK